MMTNDALYCTVTDLRWKMKDWEMSIFSMYWYCNYSGDGHVSRDTDHCQIGNMVIWSMHWTQERGKKHCSPLCIYLRDLVRLWTIIIAIIIIINAFSFRFHWAAEQIGWGLPQIRNWWGKVSKILSKCKNIPFRPRAASCTWRVSPATWPSITRTGPSPRQSTQSWGVGQLWFYIQTNVHTIFSWLFIIRILNTRDFTQQ